MLHDLSNGPIEQAALGETAAVTPHQSAVLLYHTPVRRNGGIVQKEGNIFVHQCQLGQYTPTSDQRNLETMLNWFGVDTVVTIPLQRTWFHGDDPSFPTSPISQEGKKIRSLITTRQYDCPRAG